MKDKNIEWQAGFKLGNSHSVAGARRRWKNGLDLS